MSPYILDLTSHLIKKNRYGDLLQHNLDSHALLSHIQLDLESGDVRDMNPATLGKIMTAFEIGDVMASKEDLFRQVHFTGDCEDLLRQMISTCLAYAIRDRLQAQDKVASACVAILRRQQN